MQLVKSPICQLSYTNFAESLSPSLELRQLALFNVFVILKNASLYIRN